ncbi:MAG: hypothetical protein AB1780_11515 [Pseudomonadota bacterium]
MTTKASLTKIHLEKTNFGNELRADFSNDLHYSFIIKDLHDKREIALKLRLLAAEIEDNPNLS